MFGPLVFAAGAVPYAVSLLVGQRGADGVHWNPLVQDVRAPRGVRLLPVFVLVVYLVGVMRVLVSASMPLWSVALVAVGAGSVLSVLLPPNPRQRIVYTLRDNVMRGVFSLNFVLVAAFTLTVALGRQASLMSGKAADDLIVDWLHSGDHPHATWTYVVLSIACVFQINALLQVSRAFRLAPVLIRAVSLVYIHNIRENAYVLDAIGEPMSSFLYWSHWVMAAVYLMTLALPSPVKHVKKKQVY